ncbi:hypothetical protein CBA19C8_13800 [Paraburkholderia terrae]|nr:hypothetical protein CBA19C8_13800 [Paraburkholderia terrae]
MGMTGSAALPLQETTAGAVMLAGDFLRPMQVTIDDLRQHASVTADPFDLRCYTTNRFIRKVDQYRGVLLKDLTIWRACATTGPAISSGPFSSRTLTTATR